MLSDIFHNVSKEFVDVVDAVSTRISCLDFPDHFDVLFIFKTSCSRSWADIVRIILFVELDFCCGSTGSN